MLKMLLLAGACLCVCALTSPAWADGVVAAANGAGHFEIKDELRTFAFTAIKHGDGEVSGEAQLDNRSIDGIDHIVIDCLRVSGSTAIMSGIVDHSSGPGGAPAGTHVYFKAKDNGHGNNGAPDQITLVTGTGPHTTCQANLPLPLFDVQGNITVH